MTGQGTRRQGSGSISTRNKENREEVPNHLWVESRDGYLNTRNHGNSPPSFLGVMFWPIALGLKTPKTLYFSWFWCPKKTWVSSTTIGGFWDRFLSLGLKLSASRELPRVWCVVLSPKIRPEKTKKLQGALSMRISYQGCVPPNLIHSSQSRQLGSNSVMVWENRLVHDSAAVIGETSVMTGPLQVMTERPSLESALNQELVTIVTNLLKDCWWDPGNSLFFQVQPIPVQQWIWMDKRCTIWMDKRCTTTDAKAPTNKTIMKG